MNATGLLAHFNRISDAPDAVPRLRRFILSLAVRGKLVEQDVNDEPASELAKRIHLEKIKLAKDGWAQKPLRIQLAEDEELPFTVPLNWLWVRLAEVTSYIQRGKSPKYAIADGLPVVSQKCVQWRGLDLASAKQVTPESIDTYEEIRFLRDGDLLWNSTGTGTIGRIVRVDSPPARLVCDSHVTVVRCLEVSEDYVRSWLRSDHVYGSIEDRAAGSTNQVELTSQMATRQLVPLPPLAEQHRIVAKVDELMALCDRLEAAQKERENRRDLLTAASLQRLSEPADDASAFREHVCFHLGNLPRLTTRPDQIDRLRHTIVSLAVRGRLESQDSTEESAADFLDRIRHELDVLVREGKLKKPNVLPGIDQKSVPFPIPDGWAWARFPELGEFSRGKSRHRPRNDPSLFEGGVHKFVQTGDVARANGVVTTYTGLYNDVGLAQSRLWPKGTLCITIAANIADGAILGFDACIPDSVVGFVPLGNVGNAQYFEFFMRTAKSHLEDFAPSTAQKNINIRILETVLIPVPPLAEQRRIVAKVRNLMSLCDRLETQLTAAQRESGRLLEALMHEALGEAA